MSELGSIELAETISAPLEQVFSAFRSSAALQSWFSDFAEVAFREKDRLYCWWNVGYYASGLFTKIIDNEQLAFTWSGPDEPHSTLVEIFFSAKEEYIPKAFAPEVDLTNVEATEVRIRHSGIGMGSEWSERISAYKRGWETGLENLKSVMETGIDKRIYEKPMLGILIADFLDDGKAAKAGLPISFGVVLTGTVEGTGAESAGLKKDDVIVSLNHHEIKGFQDLDSVLGSRKAGDRIEVEFYREGEKQTVRMMLSSRPIPDIPKSAMKLGESVAKIYAEVAGERNELFDGISDAKASLRPTPEEWSAKEILVHLLLTERWLHSAIACAESEQRNGGFTGQFEMIAAVASVYKLPELITELKNSEQVTVAMLKALPDEFAADKRKFVGFVTKFNQGFAMHIRSHFDQIKGAIEAAREG